ncbi:unnamed protein product [Parajaminaea phylloscopi]
MAQAHAAANNADKRDAESSNESTAANTSEVEVVDRQHGVVLIEHMRRAFGANKASLLVFLACINCVVFSYTLQNGTTVQYRSEATSAFAEHAELLAIINTVSAIIKACSQPTIAKIADVFSRQVAYTVSLGFFIIGFVVSAAAPNAHAFAVGQIFGAVGFEGLYLTTAIVLADISPLKWRGLANSLTSAWYIVTTWVAANVATDVIEGAGWRWGYGIFCIIMPVSTIPVVLFLFWAQRRAHASGEANIGTSPLTRRDPNGAPQSFLGKAKYLSIELDLLGLLLLTFGWTIFLLPFQLASKAKGKYNNPSIIAMIVTGPVILLLFALYEVYLSPKPLITKRILLNRTFQLAVVIDFFFYFTGYLRDLYYFTWVYAVTTWSLSKWSYFSNIDTFLLSVFGILIAIVIRFCHRYKALQLSGLSIRILSLGITIYGAQVTGQPSLALLVWQQLLNSLGGACSVVGTQLASQASVPHQDLAQTMAQLNLWTQIGGAVGSAVTGAVWTGNLQANFEKHGVPSTQAAAFVKSYKTVHNLPYDSALRQSAIAGYNDTIRPLFIASTAIAVIPLICGVFMPNYYLGDQHNIIENTDVNGRKAKDAERNSGFRKGARDIEVHQQESK